MDAAREANARLRELGYDDDDATVEPNGSPTRLRLSGTLLHETTAEAGEMLALLRMLPPKHHLLALRHVLRVDR
ncbi:MAG: hypothetical protein ICV64_00565 [Thermoleophilia bacterium]|nr:hypothetical protein [Thermoleophilia bacterium]